MKPTYNTILLLLLALCISTAGFASTIPVTDGCTEKIENAFGKKEFSKTINKKFPITADGKVNISNRYGQVTIKTWDNNEVKIEVFIKVNARSEDNANDVFDRITIDFNSSKDYVSAVTEIASKRSSWTSSWWGGGSSDDYAIHYDVYMPETNSLDLFNKYGNSVVSSLKGAVDLEIKYGNIHVEEIDGDVNLDLGYGNATISSAGSLNLTIKYSKVKVGSASDVTIESKYSNITIDEAADVRSETKYDHYHLGNINDYHNVGKYDDIHIKTARSFRAAAKYSDFVVGHLNDWADLDLEYGSAAINELDKAFTAIEIRGRYTQYSVTVQEGTHYQLDAVTRYAGIRYPSVFKVERHIEKGPDKEVKGYVGDKSGGKVIKARLNYGGIKVNQ